MDADAFHRVMALFKEACQLSEPERSRFLDSQCAGDQPLRARVEDMLAHDAGGGGVIETADGGAGILAAFRAGRSDADKSPREINRSQIPTLSGKYRIIRVIGEGGMGTVYEAEQTIPRRRVALKVIRRGLISQEILRRFEHEAHILGRLHHTGIAQVFEAGVAHDGGADQAFIAMEFVDGRPLTEYARANSLDHRTKLELVIRVCDAVQHAHQRGVIHRDLKPGNILVDHAGQPKVLDFGVARTVDAELQLTTMHTVSGQLIGTLPYMSPEQVSGDPEEIDTRSDVYGIGVVLFELLAGRLPHNLSRMSMADAARTIVEQDSPMLGTIDRTLRGEIETIVAKALAKEKERRYQSAGDLAGDLRRYLAGEPIEARRDSTLYFLRKSMRRHRIAVGVAAGFVVLVTGAAIALGVSYRRQSALVVEVKDKADAERDARSRAEREAAKATEVSNFVQTMLASADPSTANGSQVTVREVLDRAAARLDDGSLRDQPDTEAAVRHTIGETYRALSLYTPAEIQLRKALVIRETVNGGDSLEIAATLEVLAGVLRETEKIDEGLNLCNRSLEMKGRMVGKQDPRYAKTLVLYADLLRVGPMDNKAADAAYLQAIEIFDKAYGRRNPQTAAALGNLGASYVAFFRYDQAVAALREAHELARDLYGPDHRVTIMNANNYTAVLLALDRDAEAETIARPALDSALRVFGPDHAETGRNMYLVAQIAVDAGNSEEAIRLARGALAARRKCLPRGHSLIDWSIILLADTLAASGDATSAAEAQELMRPIVTFDKNPELQFGWRAYEARSVMGGVLAALRQFDEAEPLLLENYEKIKTAQGAKSRPARLALKRIIRLYVSNGDAESAARFQELLASPAPVSIDSHPNPPVP